MFILDKKLILQKIRLKDWNKNKFGNVKDAVMNVEVKLKDIQNSISLSGYTDILQVEEARAQHNFENALIIEEAYWLEKANIKWNCEGERNINFFHTYAKVRRKQNIITSLNINDTIRGENSSDRLTGAYGAAYIGLNQVSFFI